MLTRLRTGFSLAEVLVALTIIAVLSAVLIPILGGKVRESEGNRLVAGLTTLQTAVKAFASDVHRYPGKVVQLTDGISGNSKDVYAQNYPDHLKVLWKGPYLIRDAADLMGSSDIDPSFKVVTGDNGNKYLYIELDGVRENQFSIVEAALDAGTPTATSTTTGVITYSGTSLKFLAVPLI